MKLILSSLAGILLSIAAVRADDAPAPSPRTQLKAAIEQLQTTPDDAALREKIIALELTVKPAPKVSEEARRHFVMAMTMQKKAKGPQDYVQSIEEYNAALLIAPWWADAYYNLSVVDESAGRLDAAGAALKLFLATNPKEEDARQAQDRIYALEAQKKLQASDEAAKVAENTERERVARAKFLNAVQGHWHFVMAPGAAIMWYMDIQPTAYGTVAISGSWAGYGKGVWVWHPWNADSIRVDPPNLHFVVSGTYSTDTYDLTLDETGRLTAKVDGFYPGPPPTHVPGGGALTH